MEVSAYLIYMKFYFANGLTLVFFKIGCDIVVGVFFALKDETTRHRVNKNDEGRNQRVDPASLSFRAA